MTTPQTQAPDVNDESQYAHLPISNATQHRQSEFNNLTPDNVPRPTTTNPLSRRQVVTAITNLEDARTRREHDLSMYRTVRVVDSDDELDSESPIYDAFFEHGGSEAVRTTTNFSANEFLSLWDSVREHVIRNWNVGRGRRSPQKPKDVLFMTLATAKHGGQWDWLSKMFGMKGPTFERLILNFMGIITPKLKYLYVQKWGEACTVHNVSKHGRLFKNFPCARYATDVTFQLAYRPSGSIQEGTVYFSGKHKNYGYKVEVSVTSTGVALGCTKHYPGSVSDLDIMRKNADFHKMELEKLVSEAALEDVGPNKEDHPDHWAVLADKGYQGSSEFVRVIHPKKKPPGRPLTIEEVELNRKISSDRIIVENYFGRFCTCWG